MGRPSHGALPLTGAAALAMLAACATPRPDAPASAPIDGGHDYHTLANLDAFRVRHLTLDLTADFAARRLRGAAVLRIEALADGSRTLVLDTRGLDIDAVEWLPAGAAPAPLAFRLGDDRPPLGAPLEIELPPDLPGSFSVRIHYATRPDASGLQWLEPGQTAGRQQPFLYSQSQAIHARSWVPLQDSPQVRFTFDATVRVPPGMRALMGAEHDPAPSADGVYRFHMPQAIPSYLLAIAAGRLEFRPVGARTGVYAEPEVIEAAAREFADMETMLGTGESLFGPYRWGRYDVLLLPPSFPYGGMENPRLSFITPTVIAGDRSLVAVIAHELAHSWSGNLVTNATWRDFWLNEGFTVHLERRIMAAVYGPQRAAMEDLLGFQSLESELQRLAPADQVLAIDLRGRDPDDGASDIPYEKGHAFLAWLGARVGDEALNAFLKDYFDHFAFQSITTAQFLDRLDTRLLAQHPGAVTRAQLLEWIEAPGLPADAIRPQSDALAKVDQAREAFLAGTLAAQSLPQAAWSTQEWLYFLNNLPRQLPREQLAALDAAFRLTDAGNSEIAFSWLLLAIRSDYEPAWPRLAQYLGTIGRRKLIVPLYARLMDTPAGAARARAIYAQARPGYHPITAATLDAIVR
ncbi:MAG: M1 family metallopeptidase [Steroidobacteraceae bacterium]|nr:M1 family metallopeptidase [Steroidobacteraceae bacterium]MCW5572575.1 M1 family metallopeptidase [Steroidobacteraceae bacterium]